MTELALKQIQQVKFSFDSPFSIKLADDSIFKSIRVIRIIPKKRIVAYGMWNGVPVAAKLFFDARNAKHHMEKDAKGVKILKEYNIPTPSILFEGSSADDSIHVLLFDWVKESINLEEAWRNKAEIEDLLPLLEATVVELATQHVFGMVQHDLHLKNFLLTEKIIYTLDGAQIELQEQLLAKKDSMRNLALFLSQLGVGVEELQEHLFKHYAKARGWLLKPEDTAEIFLQIKTWNEMRWERYGKKIFRNCTDLSRYRTWGSVGMYDRDYATPELMNFLQNPDTFLQHPTLRLIKAGRSSTVARVLFDNHDLIIKRYNIKSFQHRLRRMLRPTRAVTSWRLALKLKLFGINTAKPVAYLERNILGIRGTSYYVTEYVSGKNIVDYINRSRSEETKLERIVRRTCALLKNLATLEITHGDLKATNIIVTTIREEPILIDFDGAAEHMSLTGLRAAWKKEIKRFLKNFSDQPTIRERFSKELTK